MVTKDMKRNTIAAFAAVLLIAASTSVHGVLLTPGAASPSAPATTEFSGTLIASTVVNIDGIPDINPASTIKELVVRRTVGGTLDFYFQINSIAPATGLIHQFNINSYTGFTTDVFWDNSPVVNGFISEAGSPLNGRNPGTAIPDSFARTGSGSAIQFSFPNFPTFGGNGSIAAGERSKWLVIRTNATQYGPGVGSIINGQSQNFTLFGPVPEPGSLLFGLGLLGVMGTRVIRRRRPASV